MIAVALMMAAAAAGTGSTVAVRQLEVGYGDLNLAVAADRARLETRLERAARRVCRPENARDLNQLAELPGCEAAALAGARGEMNARLAARGLPVRLAAAD